MTTSRLEQWRDETVDTRLRLVARDLDANDAAHDHLAEELRSLRTVLVGFIISASGLTIAAAINIVVLVLKG